MQHEFWPGTGPTSEDGETSRPFYPTPRASDAERGGRGELLHVAKGAPSPRGSLNGESTSSRAGSRARTSATRARVQDSPGNAPDSGLSSREWFARFDLDSCLWRTSQLSLLGGLMPFSGRWPRSGTMRNGRAFRLPPLVPRISGTAFSYWPTPNVPNGGRVVPMDARWNTLRTAYKADGKKIQVGLESAVRKWPIPTPTAADSTGSRNCTANNGQGSTGHTGTTLCDFVTMYPTPSASGFECKDVERMVSRREECKKRHGNGNGFGLTLGQHVALQTVGHSLSSETQPDSLSGAETQPKRLNPAWVEWLQGFPPGWTEV